MWQSTLRLAGCITLAQLRQVTVFPALLRGREVRQGGVGLLEAQALVTAWAELLQETLSEFGRLLLVVDDAQWIDESSQQLLALTRMDFATRTLLPRST